MQVRPSRSRSGEQQSTWSLLATIALLILAIIIIGVHLISRTGVQDPPEGNLGDVQTLHVNDATW
jgi:hypothetical protein